MSSDIFVPCDLPRDQRRRGSCCGFSPILFPRYCGASAVPSGGNPESFYAGRQVENVTDNGDVGEADLAGGTRMAPRC